MSGRRVSNSQPIAWKAIALPIELLPHALFLSFSFCFCPSGQEWIRTTEVERQRIYSPPHLAALEPALRNPLSQRTGSNRRPADYKSAALPAELLWQLNSIKRTSRFSHAYTCVFWEGKGKRIL